MRALQPAFALVLLLALSCKKEEGTPASSGVSITFRTDSGFTYLGDTVPQGDTLRVGAIITEGSGDLERFYLAIKLDAGPDTGLDTVDVSTDPFTYEAVHVTRSQAGTEQLIFIAEEEDGDRTTRRLTFVVP